MPHNHLQDALAYLHTLYATYEAQGITITGSRMPLTQYANFAAMKYLLFLANQDRVITDAETNFINNCLQQSATTQTMERFLQQFSISFSGAADSLLALLAALVRVDLQGSGVEGSISLLWLETIAQMGTQFSLNTAGKVEPQQQIVQNSMMQQLSRYRDAAMRGCRRPELEKAAVIPANFNAEKPPIPAEKEAVVDDAEITEAPTETLDELLAQLHQLRGRVGRGEFQSYCIFISTSEAKETMERLQILNHSNDGFHIASEDLKLRGPGDIFGIRQSGEFSFVLGDIYTDASLLKEASEAVDTLLCSDPELSSEDTLPLRQYFEEHRSANMVDFRTI